MKLLKPYPDNYYRFISYVFRKDGIHWWWTSYDYQSAIKKAFVRNDLNHNDLKDWQWNKMI